jgi:CBS domain-containing protein
MTAEKRRILKRSEDYYIKVLLTQIKIHEVMTTPVISVDVETNFKEIPHKFGQYNIRHLPVVGGDHKLVGLISQKELFRICPPHKTDDGDFVYDEGVLSGIILKHVMVREPFFMQENQCIGEAATQFVEKKYGCIPIVNDTMQLTGIITQEDILRIAVQIYQE